MSQFTSPLIVKFIGNNKWENYKAFEYHVGMYPSDEIIITPKGFKTNFASVPRIFWGLISPVDNHAKASILHDYCYSIGYVSRKHSDEIFKESMKVLKVNPIKIFLMYWAVRLFGKFAWCSRPENCK
jgi:hypothetical protein